MCSLRHPKSNMFTKVSRLQLTNGGPLLVGHRVIIQFYSSDIGIPISHHFQPSCPICTKIMPLFLLLSISDLHILRGAFNRIQVGCLLTTPRLICFDRGANFHPSSSSSAPFKLILKKMSSLFELRKEKFGRARSSNIVAWGLFVCLQGRPSTAVAS